MTQENVNRDLGSNTPWHDDPITKNSVTFEEIFNQPRLWRKIFGLHQEQSLPADFFADPSTEYILSGAGSSAFVAETVATAFQTFLPGFVRAAATTDIVTHPRSFFRPGRKQVMVSFARSGNSPESVASVNVASQLNPEIAHLIVTCNREGALAKLARPHIRLVLLPEEANDRGLAMIGSVSGMILVAYLLAGLIKTSGFISASEKFLQGMNGLRELAQLPFERVVCLGSGSFLGLARESHLKIQELCDGRVICKHDSYLGFRHGPKAVVNDKTLVIYFISPLPYVREYEVDLIRSIAQEKSTLHTLAVCDSNLELPVDSKICFDFADSPPNEQEHLLPYLLPVQILAALKSKNLGLDPDAPSVRGAIHRVVQGVRIYPFRDV